jgi:DNA-binding NarL/FixJ family response regulator
VVGEVETGEASVEAARELHPDLVLMDVNLPGINGLEATQRILAESDGKRPVVVLVLSTYEAAEYAPRASDAGAAGFIPKSESPPTASSRSGAHPRQWPDPDLASRGRAPTAGVSRDGSPTVTAGRGGEDGSPAWRTRR